MHTLTIKIENDSATALVVDFLETMKNRGVKLINDEIDELIEEVTKSCPDYTLIQKTANDDSVSFDSLLEEFENENRS